MTANIKKWFILILMIAFTGSIFAQFRVEPNRPYSMLNSGPGYITINELTGGYGLAGHTMPFSKYFFGFTTIHGYQVNANYIIAGGTGFAIYESGVLVPLFLDFRFSFYISRLTPYLYADGGLLLDIADFNSTKLFINPGAGIRYSYNRSLAFTLGAGFISQVDGRARETFVSLKAGVVYKMPRR